MSLPYYIEGTSKLWLKDNFAPYGTNVYYIQKISGYSPNADKIFKFHDNFDDNSINTTKWFTDGYGTKEEVDGTAHVTATSQGFARFVTVQPLIMKNYIVEYDFKVISTGQTTCFMGYTSHYTDGSELANWYSYISTSRYIYFYTRIGTDWSARWTYTTPLTLNTWYKVQLIETDAGIQFRLLNSSSVLIAESAFYSYTKHVSNSLYFGNRTTNDNSYWDNFKVRTYCSIDPTITVKSETGGYKVIVQNNSSEELRDYQFSILASSLGTLSATTSVCIDVLNRTPLVQKYYNTNIGSNLNIQNMNRDIVNNHELTMYNSSKSYDRFNCPNNATVFNGTSTRGIVTHNDDLNLFSSSYFTLIFWVKQNGASTSSIILSKASGTGANRWDVHDINNEVGFYIYDADSTLTFAGGYSPITINDNLWHMVAFVRSGTNILTYKDGIYVRTFPLTNISNFSNTYNMNIGCKYTTVYTNYFNGTISEIVSYNETAFTDNDVKRYYDLSKEKYIMPIKTGGQF